MLSLATSRSKKPSAQPPDPNNRLGFGETAARRSFFFACVIFANVRLWHKADIDRLQRINPGVVTSSTSIFPRGCNAFISRSNFRPFLIQFMPQLFLIQTSRFESTL
jgi:hypothetical protein